MGGGLGEKEGGKGLPLVERQKGDNPDLIEKTRIPFCIMEVAIRAKVGFFLTLYCLSRVQRKRVYLGLQG